MTGMTTMEQNVLNSLLIEALDSYDVEHAKTYVRKGSDVHVSVTARETIQVNGSQHSTSGSAPLYHYMLNSRWTEEMSDFLLGQGVSVDVKNFNGNTPLMIAVKNGDLRKVSYFLQRHADPLATNNAGEMVLQQAQLLSRSVDSRTAIIDALVAKLEDAPKKEAAPANANTAKTDVTTHQGVKPMRTVAFNNSAEAGNKTEAGETPVATDKPDAKPKAGFNL